MNNHSIQYTEKESSKIDLVGLLHWYHDRVTKHKRTLKGAMNVLYLYFAFVLLAFISATISIIKNPEYIFIYIIFLPNALIIRYYFKKKYKKVASIITGGRYVELNESQFKKIWAASHEIMLKMKLSHKLRIYYVKKNQAEASVVLEGNTIYLLLSRGMITYSQHNFKDVESIIGHEFGHVCQGDSKILLIGKNTIQIPLIMSVASWIFLKFGDYTALTGMFRLQQDLGGSWFILFYCWLFVVQRREAEYLADVASIIFVENSTIKDIIEKSVPQSGNLNYPSKSRRLAFIQKSLEKYNSMSQPFPVF